MVKQLSAWQLFHRLKIVILFFNNFYFLHGQNLVSNPSFENYSTCPTAISQLNLATPWVSPGIATPDYFNSCYVNVGGNLSVDVPINFSGNEFPHTGDGYVGFFPYINPSGFPGSDYREYIQAPLLTPMVAGTTYNISLYVSLSDSSVDIISGTGILFSNTAVSPIGPSNFSLQDFDPQIVNFDSAISVTGWTLITQCYTAIGDENYITIGNFEVQPPIYALGNPLVDNYCYYYVDDVSIIPIFQENFGLDSIYCFDDSLLLNASVTADSNYSVSYSWQDGSIDSTFLVTEAGTYWVEISSSGNCTIRDTIQVYYYPTSTLNLELGSDTTLCNEEELWLDVSNPDVLYLWQDGSTDPTFLVTEPGIYWVEISSDANCILNIDTIQVNYYPIINVDLGSDTTLCAGDELILNASSPNASYIWQDGSTNAQYPVSQSGVFWVEITDSGNCSQVDSITVTILPSLPTIGLGEDTTIQFCDGETITFELPDVNSSYLWFNGSIGNSITINEEGTYWVQLYDSCWSTVDTITIEGCRSRLMYPSAFSPNADKTNDLFLPAYINHINFVSIIIYNRWGQRVFASSDIDEGWDGTFNGKSCSVSVYVWEAKYIDYRDQNKSISGTVTLVQ